MYIRFVIEKVDPDSQKRMGIFHAIRELRDNGELESHELDKMNEIMGWFSDNLERPDKFNRSNRKKATGKGISWFKDTAKEHINRMYEIVSVLKSHGINVSIKKSARLGFVVFEDNFQICAEPFSDTNA
jgi:hypothetical protein